MATVEVIEVPPTEAVKTFVLTLNEREAEYVATALGPVNNRTDIDIFAQLSLAGARWGSKFSERHAGKFFTSKRDDHGYFTITDKD